MVDGSKWDLGDGYMGGIVVLMQREYYFLELARA